MAKVFNIQSPPNDDRAKKPRSGGVCFEDLLRRCCDENSPPPWDEFFQHFNRLIIKTIRKTLIRWDQALYQPDYDVVNEVYLRFVERIMEERKLEGVKHSAALPSWVRSTVQNITIEWLRKQNTRNIVLNNHERKNSISLNKPVGREGEQLLEDVTGHDTMEELWEKKELTERLDDIMGDVEQLDEEAFLLVKAFCLFYEPLSEREIELIAKKRNTAKKVIKSEIDELMEDLATRNDGRIKKQSNEVIRWFRVRQKEATLSQMQRYPLSDGEQTTALAAQIEHESTKLELSRKKGRDIVRPRNSEIAHLLGIPENQSKQLSLKMMRIRNKLKALMEARLQHENETA
jgi:RNA polymerase sigma factor (sigma-70 family)